MSPARSAPPKVTFTEERKRRDLLQAIYEKLPRDAREDLDRRAQVLAEKELGEKGSPARLAFRKLDHRNALLDAMGTGSASEESQNTVFGPARDETEPNAHQLTRT